MISLLVCSRVAGNENWGLPKLLEGLKEMSSDYRNFEVLVKFDSDDERVPEVLPILTDYPFKVGYLIEPRGRGYIDIHIGYTRLMSIADPRSVVMGAFADDFIITVKGWDEIVLAQTRKFDDDIYMIHQRPHPPYYREDYKTEPFYMDFGLDQLDFIEIIDEGPFWSRKLLEICGGLGHVSFTDAWTICLEWYLYHSHGLKRTNFLKEPVIHRTLHENIDTEKSERWSTDRLYNFDFIQGDFYRSMVKNQARNISLNILAETKISDLISSDRQASPADRDQIVLLKKLLGTAQGALRYGRKEAALSEFKRFVEQFPNFPEGHHGLGLTLVLMSRFQEAVLPLHQAVELAPEQVEYHNDLGVAYASAGDVERAETAFLSELELNPENIDTKLNLADIYRVQGRIGDAIALIEPHAKGDSPHPGVIKTLRALVNEVSSRPFVQPPAGQTVPRPAEPNKAQKSSPLPHPNVVFMHMIDRCNARCLFCDDAYIAHKTGHRISFDQFQQIARNVNFTKVKMVIFTGGGEPLLHDELCGMIQFMNSEYPGTMVGVNSNAIALTRDLSERLAEYQIGLMSVSLNAATKETYKKIMQVDAFDKVIANLKVYQEIHTGLDKNNLRLTFAACRSSVEELPKFVELSARLRVMDCQTSYMQLWPGDVRQTMAGKGKEALHWFSEEESLFNHQTLSDRMAAESRKKAEQWGVPFMTEALFSEELARTVCRQPFESFLISFDGETYPCCGGDTLFRKSKRSFGNILTTPFPDIWNSEAYDRLRQTVTHPDNPPQTGECGICPTYWKGRRGLERRFFIIDRFLEHPKEAKGLIADKKAAVPDGDDSAPKNAPILSEEREGDPSQTNGPSLSILIPSLREAQLKRCLERIEAHTKDVDYEVVVISPFEVSGPRIKHVQEAEPKGTCYAYFLGLESAKGEYVAGIADDTYVTPQWASNMLVFMAPHKKELFLGNFRAFDVKGERTEPGTYGKLYSCFPFIKRSWIPRIGGFYDTCFHSYYGDPDLSMRVWHQGGSVATCPNAWIEFANVPDEVETFRKTNFFEKDQETFFRRWHDLYGHLARSRTFEGIQLPIADQISKRIPAEPPESCVGIFRAVQFRDWAALERLLSDSSADLCVSEYGLRFLTQRDGFLRPLLPRAEYSKLQAWMKKHPAHDGRPVEGEAKSPTRLRVLFLSPSYENNRFGLPPYNIAYLANFLKGRPDIEFSIINGDAYDLDALRQLIARSEYDIFATGGMITLASYFETVFNVSLRNSPGAWRVLGGPITSTDLDHIFKTIPADVCVIGEGEQTFSELLDLYVKQKKGRTDPSPVDYEKIDGIAFVSEDAKVETTKPRTPINLSKIDLRPAWELFDVEKYTQWNPLKFFIDLPPNVPQRQFSLLIGRGCPFNCNFCGSPFGRKVRARPAEQALAEIEDMVKRYRLNVLYIMSETFFFQKKQVLDFCHKLKKRKLGVRWICNLRVDMIDDEIAHAMKDAGCDHITYGIESGSGRVLKLMNKKSTVEQNIGAMEITRRGGIYPGGSIMFGYLDETADEMRQTVDLMLTNNHVPSNASIVTAIPGTALYTQALVRGFIKDESKYLSRLDGRIDVCDEPKANLSQVPNALFWPTVVSEFRRLMTGLFRQGTARIEPSGKNACGLFAAECPFCGSEIPAMLPGGPIPLGTQLFCRKCRRIVWVDPFGTAEAYREHGQALQRFGQRINSENATYAYIGYNINSKWLLKLNLWDLKPEPFAGIFDLNGNGPLLREYGASILPVSELLRQKPEYLFLTQHESVEKIIDVLVQAGYSRDRIMPFYPLSSLLTGGVQPSAKTAQPGISAEKNIYPIRPRGEKQPVSGPNYSLSPDTGVKKNEVISPVRNQSFVSEGNAAVELMSYPDQEQTWIAPDKDQCIKPAKTERNPRFVYLKDQIPLSAQEFESAKQVCRYIKDITSKRPETVRREGLDPEIYLPAANWALERIQDLNSYGQILSGDYEIISNLRLFSQCFTGYRLIDMRIAEGTTIPQGVPEDTDRSLEIIAKREDPSVAAYALVTGRLPEFLHISPPPKFGEVGWLYNGKIVNYDTFVYLERVALLYEGGILDGNGPDSLRHRCPLNVLEIGAGYGGLAYHLKKILPQANYYVVDLPESLIYSGIYLPILFPDDEHLFLNSENSNEILPREKPGFIFLPNYLFPRLRKAGVKFDLVINTLSMSEMSEKQVREYCGGIGEMLADRGLFFEQNQDNRRVGLLNACDVVAGYFQQCRNLTGRVMGRLTQGYPHLWSNPAKNISSPAEETNLISEKPVCAKEGKREDKAAPIFHGEENDPEKMAEDRHSVNMGELFDSGNFATVAMKGSPSDWRTYAAMGLVGKAQAAIEGLDRFDHPEAHFYSAVASWIDGDEARAARILEKVSTRHAKNLLALIRKPKIDVLAQLPWKRLAPWDLLTAGRRDAKFEIGNISFHPDDLKNKPYADIRKYYDVRRPPDFYVCAMVEWHLIPPNLQCLPCPILGQTGDFDIHIQAVYPWLQLFDGLIVTDGTEWEDLRRLARGTVSTFPKSFGLSEHLPAAPATLRQIDVFLSGSVTHPYWHEKSKLFQQALRMKNTGLLAIDGFMTPESYHSMLGKSKVSFTHIRHSGAMPTRAIEALSMGCCAVVQKGSVLTLYAGEEQGLLTYDFDKNDLVPVIENIVGRWSEFEERAQKGAALVRREFALPRVASQYFRFLTFLAAKPMDDRRMVAAETLYQKRSVLYKGWLAAPEKVLQTALQYNMDRWRKRLKLKPTSVLYIDVTRELMLECAVVLKSGLTPAHVERLREIFNLYGTGIAKFPKSLVLRFNFIRIALHLGKPEEKMEALRLTDETLSLPASHWEIDAMEDVFPYDLESTFFNYRRYLDLAKDLLKGDASVKAGLIRTIRASLFYYLGNFTKKPAHLREAAQLDSDFPFYRMEHAKLLVQTGGAVEGQEAGAVLMELAEKTPFLEEALTLLEQLQTRGVYQNPRFEELKRVVRRAHHSIIKVAS